MDGVIDLHIHSYPCLIPRIADDRKIIMESQNNGLEAIVLKCHHESTVSRAYTLQSEFDEIKVYGGIVLNDYVGGINPQAVEASLKLGGKAVWMPTIDANNHAVVHGSKGVYDVQSSNTKEFSEGISIYDESGKVSKNTLEVLELVSEYEVMLGTAHLSKKEISDLVKVGKEIGVKKFVITHPFFKVPSYDLEELEELVCPEVKFEFGYCTVSPMWNYASIEDVFKAIKTLGVENCHLVSDGGQSHNPLPHEGLKIFAQCLYEKGLDEKEIDMLIKENPKMLLE